MTIAWMLCYLLVGTLLLAVALGADRIAAAARWPRRVVLSVVMLAMCILPLLLRQIRPLVPVFVYSGKPPAMSATSAPVVMSAVGTSPVAPVEKPTIVFSVSRARGNRVVVSPDSPVLPFDRWALVAWIVAAVAYAGVLLVAYRRMRRARRHWTAAPAHIERSMAALTGVRTRVWCSDGIGPAAFGVIRPAVVIPDWALSLDAEALDLLLRHEASHVTARDPLLLHVALAAVIAMPWNVPLLIAYRRLHRAVEHDCDARVIADTQDARGYARLLLETASRFAGAGAAQAWSRTARWLPAPVPGIGTRRSELELRLRALVQPVSTWRSRARVLGAGVVVFGALLVACSVPSPERMRSESAPTQTPFANRPSLSGLSRTRPKGTTAEHLRTPLDSIVIMEAAYTEFERMMPRGQALQDSIVEATARAAVPQAFQFTDSIVDLWVLLDAQYRVERYAIGPQYYSVRRKAFDGDTVSQPATRTTPRGRFSWGEAEYLRAFPGVKPEEIRGLRGILDVRRGARTVQVLWIRHLPDNRAQLAPPGFFSLSDVLLRSQRSWEFNETQRSTALSLRKGMLGDMALKVAATILQEASTMEPFLWLLVGDNGSVVRSAVGRDGMDPSLTGLANQGTGAAKGSSSAALPDICAAMRKKFREVDPKDAPTACGVDTVSNGRRRVTVIWGFANLTR